MKSKIPEPIFLTVPNAAKLCGVSRNTMYTWVRKGKLSAYQTPGRTNLIRPSDLVDFMESSGLFVPDSISSLAQNDAASYTDSAMRAQMDAPWRKAILVVDDDASSRAVLVRTLNSTYHMLQAQTGFEALHLLTLRDDIAAVLLDLRMPGQHGLETLREIKRLCPKAHVLIVTGFVDEIPEEYTRNGWVSRIIEKPIFVHELLQLMKDLLQEEAPAVSFNASN